MFKKLLLHEKIHIRFCSLLGIIAAIVFCAWALSYLLLPEGIIRGRNVGQALAGNELAGGSVWLEWLRIFAINLGVMIILIIAPNNFRTEGEYPLGYIAAALIAMMFGVILGTDSFTLSMGGKTPPTVEIFGKSGLYEIAAFVLAAAATVNIGKFRLVGKWPKQTIEAIVPSKDKRIVQERNVGVTLAITILILACGWEAYQISIALATS
jgi:hypothetical protein